MNHESIQSVEIVECRRVEEPVRGRQRRCFGAERRQPAGQPGWGRRHRGTLEGVLEAKRSQSVGRRGHYVAGLRSGDLGEAREVLYARSGDEIVAFITRPGGVRAPQDTAQARCAWLSFQPERFVGVSPDAEVHDSSAFRYSRLRCALTTGVVCSRTDPGLSDYRVNILAAALRNGRRPGGFRKLLFRAGRPGAPERGPVGACAGSAGL